MFFTGSFSTNWFLLTDLLLFFAAWLGYRLYSGKRPNLVLMILLYSLQLFLLLLVVPLRPDGVIIHVTGYESRSIQIIPEVKGKFDPAEKETIKLKNAQGNVPVNLKFSSDADSLPRYLLKFGNKPDNIDIKGVEIYSTVLTRRLIIAKTGQTNLKKYFTLNDDPEDKRLEKASLHEILQKNEPHRLIYRLAPTSLTDADMAGITTRAALWTILCTVVFGIVVTIPATFKLSMQHTQGTRRSAGTAFAYVYSSVLVVVVSLSLCLILSEYGIRYYYRDVLSTASGKNYFYNKSQHLFLAEENGFRYRGKGFGKKQPGIYRVVVLGDSISYGQGVYPYTLRYSDLIQKQVKQPNLEVVNISMCGMNLPDYLKLLPFLKALRPDFVIYQWFINDMEVESNSSLFTAPPLLGNGYWHKLLMNNSALYFMLQRGWTSLLVRQGKILSYEKYIKDSYTDANSSQSVASSEMLKQLFARIEGLNIPFAVVLFPHAGYPIKDYPFAFMHERIQKICQNNDIPCLDLRQAYAPYDKNLQSLWANKLDQHPSALAHKIAAEQILQFLGSVKGDKYKAIREELNF